MADLTLDSPPRQQLKAEVEIEEEMEDQDEKARPVDSLLENEPLPSPGQPPRYVRLST
jgi:hypothetical protein